VAKGVILRHRFAPAKEDGLPDCRDRINWQGAEGSLMAGNRTMKDRRPAFVKSGQVRCPN
jgi:hypothetical protein